MIDNGEIKIISNGIFQSGDRLDAKYIESILEENTKLKAEIEQLKWINYENLKTENDVHNRLIKEKEAEIEQLKADLEKSVKLQNVLSKLLKGSEFARCYMCDNSMKNITLDGKNNGCDGSCYHEKNYTENDLIEKIKCELDRIERRK